MTKKSVLIVNIIAVLFLVALAFLQNGNCYSVAWCRNLWEEINLLGAVLFIFIPVLLFSLITYKMREEVFRSWVHLVYWWAPMTMFLTFITQGSSNMLFSWDEKSTAGFFSILFALISLILIVYKSIKLRGK